MPDNNEIDENIQYSIKLSDYFYPKLQSIDNENEITEEDDFSAEDINEYDLDVLNNGKINISTTKKLVKYLKSLIEVNVKNLNSKINRKLDANQYVIDNQLNSNSQNPLTNSVITSSLNNKSNINHIHNMSDITSLVSTLESKASGSTVSSHINNKSNPHAVSLSQLGITDSGWDSIPITQSSLSASDYPYCRKYGKIVILDFHAEMYKTFAQNTVVFTLKSQYRPNHTLYGYAYKVGTGDCFTYILDTNGNLKFGANISNGTIVRINEVFFTK